MRGGDLYCDRSVLLHYTGMTRPVAPAAVVEFAAPRRVGGTARRPYNRRMTRYCVTVDTEEEWDWASGYPTARPTVANVRHLPRLQQVCERHAAAVVYFTNHAVLSDPAAAAVIRELAARPRVEIGLHLHPWNTPPIQPGESVPTRDSFLHTLPWGLAKAKLDATVAAFAAAGLTPKSYRGGRYSTSPQIQHYLRDRGVLADASVLPFTTWTDDGAMDFRDRDPTPVRRQTPAGPLWELPLTMGYTRRPFAKWDRIVTAANRGAWRALKAGSVLDRFGIVRKAWLNLENPAFPDPAAFVPVVAAEGLPFACFTLHSSSLLPGGSPYARTAADVERVLQTTDRALAAAAKAGWRPMTVTETATELEAEYTARSQARREDK